MQIHGSFAAGSHSPQRYSPQRPDTLPPQASDVARAASGKLGEPAPPDGPMEDPNRAMSLSLRIFGRPEDPSVQGRTAELIGRFRADGAGRERPGAQDAPPSARADVPAPEAPPAPDAELDPNRAMSLTLRIFGRPEDPYVQGRSATSLGHGRADRTNPQSEPTGPRTSRIEPGSSEERSGGRVDFVG